MKFKMSELLGLLILCSAFSTVAFAACPNMGVRPNSPCKTESDVCVDTDPGPALVCSAKGSIMKFGDFQNDLPAQGKTTTGTGAFAPCRVLSGCTPVGGVCDEVAPFVAKAHETIKTINCPVGG